MALRDAPDPIIGQSDNFLAVLEKVSRVAPLSKPVLIIGERGSGKELIAAQLNFT
jgi:psp operon transcriptional activator